MWDIDDVSPIRKLENLFVRACKSNDPEKRLMSIYRRFYHSGEMSETMIHANIIGILLNICRDFNISPSLHEVFNEMNPNQSSFWGKTPVTYNMKWLRFLVSRIRNTEAKKFPGFRAPRCFREGGRCYKKVES